MSYFVSNVKYESFKNLLMIPVCYKSVVGQ